MQNSASKEMNLITFMSLIEPLHLQTAAAQNYQWDNFFILLKPSHFRETSPSRTL